MRAHNKLIVLAVIAVVGLVMAYEFSPPSQTARAAAEQLKMARTLNFGGGGYAGIISEAEESLFTLLSSHRGAGLLCEAGPWGFVLSGVLVQLDQMELTPLSADLSRWRSNQRNTPCAQAV